MTSKKIIVTLGPSTRSAEIMGKLNERDISYIRLNLSHTPIDAIEGELEFYKSHSSIPLVIDTEGSQIRTGDLSVPNITLNTGSKLRLYNHPVTCSAKELFLRPCAAVNQLQVGDLVFIDFDTAILRVDDISTRDEDAYVSCTVITGGVIGNNKAVTLLPQREALSPLSEKDVKAITIAKNMGINVVNLSFADTASDIAAVKEINPDAYVISKVETQEGVGNLPEIIEASDAILIDRGDLSREVPLEKIAFAQKYIIAESRKNETPVFVATNFLDTMMKSKKPSRAEINDIMNTLLDGASGLVLAAETAVGKHPVECVSLLESIMHEFEEPIFQHTQNAQESWIQCSEYFTDKNFKSAPLLGNSLVPPHGGTLVQQYATQSDIEKADACKKLELSEEQVMDVELIATGAYSPLTGFLCEDDFWSVLTDYKLCSDVMWPLPICLQKTAKELGDISIGDTIVLTSKKRSVALLDVQDMFTPDMTKASSLLYGTNSTEHPGVKKLQRDGEVFIGGKVTLISRTDHLHKKYEFTPLHTRKIFESRGWSRVVGFHSRNPIHRSHEFIQLQALKVANADGLFIHPVVGKKKQGDFTADSIIKSYEVMLSDFYDEQKVAFGTFATYSRYAGPREALFTALCRQNFGCSHFIIGRDHTGVGNFYAKDASQKIFERFPDIGIKTICFDNVVYDKGVRSYAFEGSSKEGSYENLSGTKIRDMLASGTKPPSWLMRPEVSTVLLERQLRGENLFFEASDCKQAKVLWFSGFSGSGKSTIATELKERLQRDGKSVLVLDGDDVRAKHKKKLGFSKEDIGTNNRIIAKMAKENLHTYDVILIPVIAPYEEFRSEAKDIIGDSFKLVFVDASIDECIKRDPKGLYEQVMQGKIKNFIGFSEGSPYERPLEADMIIKTEELDVEAAVRELERKFFERAPH